MKIKLDEIVNSAELINELQKVNLPVKVSYRIKRFIDKISPDLKEFNKKRVEILNKYCKLSADGKSYDVSVLSDEKKIELNSKLKDIIDKELDIDFDKIKIEDLGDSKIEPRLLIPFIFEI